MAHIDDVRKLTAKIAQDDDRRAGRVANRDVAMAEAKANGSTWAALQAASGLSLRGAQLAVERGRKSEAFTSP